MSTETTLVLQSHAPGAGALIERCTATVRDWAGRRGYDYRLIGDELFEPVPGWFRDRAGAARLPMVADLGRLLWLQDALQHERFARAIWVDADTLIVDPGAATVEVDGDCAFGRERWVQVDGSRLRVYRNVHNAVCLFRAGSPTLPFLIQTTQRLVRRADPARMPPQFVGPKLLTALNSIVGFALLDAWGALSPAVLADLAGSADGAWQRLVAATPVPLGALNLCLSVNAPETLERIIDRLPGLARSPAR